MNFKHDDIKKGIILGAIAGIVWGLVAIPVNALSGVFTFENGLIHRIITFVTGGAIFGVVVGGFMAVTKEIIPLKKPFSKAVLISSSLWIILRGGAFFLSLSMPSRYHPSAAQTVQGFLLAVILGSILGWLWDREQKMNHVG